MNRATVKPVKLNAKQLQALRTLRGHGNTMNTLVRKKLVTYHQKVEYGKFDGKLVTFWYTRTLKGEAVLKCEFPTKSRRGDTP